MEPLTGGVLHPICKAPPTRAALNCAADLTSVLKQRRGAHASRLLQSPDIFEFDANVAIRRRFLEICEGFENFHIDIIRTRAVDQKIGVVINTAEKFT